ncbi:MAG: PhoU domain-containing protein [Nitrososphaeria archaeon]
MLYRKVQEVGKGTLLVSLPKDWVKKYGVKRGDILELEVDQLGNIILCLTKKKFSQNLSIVDCKQKSLRLILDEVAGAYLLGCDRITVSNLLQVKSTERENIRSFLSKLAGLEVIEEDRDSITAEFVTDITLLNPNKILGRMSLLAKTMFLDSLNSLIKRDIDTIENVIKLDDEVDRLYFLIVRLMRSAIQSPEIMRKFNLSAIECLDHRLYASLIESIGDYAYIIAANIKNGVHPLNDELVNEFIEIRNFFESMFDIAYKAYKVKDITLKENILTVSENVEKKVDSIRTLIINKPINKVSKIFSIISAINFARKALVDITDLTTPSIKIIA